MRYLYAEANYGIEEIKAVNKTLKTQRLCLMGSKNTKKLEKKIAKLFDKKFGLMTNSGSSANLIAIASLNLPRGSEIITPALTFSTSVSPIVQCGLVPVFIDINLSSLQIDVNKIEKAITKKTKAILAPNLIGNICEWEKIRKISKKYGLLTIEDSADTLGYKFKNSIKGFSDVATTSFYASHIVTGAGFGGMVCFNSESQFNYAKSLISWGRRSSQYGESEDFNRRFKVKLGKINYDDKYIFDHLGYNFIPSEISASFALENLKKLNINIYKRNENFTKLTKMLKNFDKHIFTFKSNESYKFCWLAFPLLLKSKDKNIRSSLQLFLEKKGIQTRTIFSGNITRQPVSKLFKWKKKGSLKNSDLVMEKGILLGCHQRVKFSNIDYLESCLKEFFNENKS